MKKYMLLASLVLSLVITACGGNDEDVEIPTRVVAVSTFTPKPSATIEPTKPEATATEVEAIETQVKETAVVEPTETDIAPTIEPEQTPPVMAIEPTTEFQRPDENEQQADDNDLVPDVEGITDFSLLVEGETATIRGGIDPETNIMSDVNGVTVEVMLPLGSAQVYADKVVTVTGNVIIAESGNLGIIPTNISANLTTVNPFEATASAPQVGLPGIDLIEDYSALPQDAMFMLAGEIGVETNEAGDAIAIMTDANGVSVEIVLPPGSASIYEGQIVTIMGQATEGRVTPISITVDGEQSGSQADAFAVDAESTPDITSDPAVTGLTGITETLPFVIDPDQSGLAIYDALTEKIADSDNMAWTSLQGMQGDEWIIEFNSGEQMITYAVSPTGAVTRTEQSAIPLPVFAIDRSKITVDSSDALDTLGEEMPLQPTQVRLYATEDGQIEWALLNGQSVLTIVDATE